MFDEFSMVAPHSKRTVGEDIIFKVNREAGQADQRFGAANIVNASVGSLLDDSGSLAVIPTVVEILRGLEAEDFSAYAPIAGVPQFLDAAKEAVFRENRISGYIGYKHPADLQQAA
jgi:aromatic-amino-acid transaminase